MQRVAQVSMSEQAYRDLKWALIVGDHPPGQKISIRAYASGHDMSMTPVREALKRLSSERALSSAANKSFAVPQLTPKRISDLLFLRASLEGIATELAVVQLGSPQIDRLRELAAQMDEDIDDGRIRDYLVHNYNFHFCIYAASGNPDLVSLIEGLWAQTGPFVAQGARQSEVSGEWRDTHARIVEAIVARDSSYARRMVEADISWGIELYREMCAA